MKYFKIQPDKLNSKQKKKVYWKIICYSIILFFVFYHVNTLNGYKSEIRAGNNFEIIDCEIIGYDYKFNRSVFSYSYNKQTFKSSKKYTSSFLIIGEKYEGRLNKSNPEVAVLLLKKPIIDSIKFKKSSAKVIKVISKSKGFKMITFSYNILEKNFNRTQYVDHRLEFEVNEKVTIYYKSIKPEIAYLKY
ncbi:hypothetical protein [Tenacibaculum xiamenense]|uniref:hypothetical protein n=1 Tax=Tenacibaculum xiamenense TaxID=1261553 RepID=UPI0038935C82